MENSAEKANTEPRKENLEEHAELNAEKQGLLEKAKKEILTKYKNGEDIELRLFALGEAYQIGKNLQGPFHKPLRSREQHKFLRIISHSLNAIEGLGEKSIPRDRVVKILSEKPIQEWPGVVRETPSSKNTGEKRTT